MSRIWNLESLLHLLGGDREVVEKLWEAGFLPTESGSSYAPDDVELARIAQTLVRDLDVNWAGVEVILQMRSELIETRGQVMRLLALLRSTLETYEAPA